MNTTDVEDQESPFPKTSRKAIISFILGLCSLLSLVPIAFFLNSNIDLLFSQPYFVLLYLLIWILLPISALSIGTQAKKIATERTGGRLAATGFMLGLISLLLVSWFFCTIFTFAAAFSHLSDSTPIQFDLY